MDNDQLKELVNLCLEGDTPSQKELYVLISPRLFSICLRYSSDYSDAEDMLQEGFIKLFKKLDKYKNTGSFMAWASRVMANNCIDCIRRKPKLYTISDEFAPEKGSPSLNALDSLVAEDLVLLIQSLPEGYRTIFNMYVVEGYSHKEIAEKLEISDGTSKSQLNRARKLLQKKIEELKKEELLRRTNA